MKLSLVIPAHNEEASIGRTVDELIVALRAASLSFEILVVNDHSSDQTTDVLDTLCHNFEEFHWIDNKQPNGFGYAIQTGLAHYDGDAVCIVMADASDDPGDVIAYYKELEKGAECVFGSRFIRGSKVIDYPRYKFTLNRLTNYTIAMLFGFSYNDTTNAFKCYKRSVIDGLMPLLSCHFNLTVELPLKAIVRGYKYSVIPISWQNRTAGTSKLRLQEMGSRYAFIILYVWLEKILSRGDYRRRDSSEHILV